MSEITADELRDALILACARHRKDLRVERYDIVDELQGDVLPEARDQFRRRLEVIDAVDDFAGELQDTLSGDWPPPQ